MGLTSSGAIYGLTTYGTEYYGATPTVTPIFRWGIEVDWDGDGVFDGSNEAARLLQIQCNRGRKNWLQPNGQGFYPISVGTCHITLDNHDGRYDAWNTSSPLYPNIEPGKEVYIHVIDAATETPYDIFYGMISGITPSGYGANAIVKITIEDGLRFLRNNYSFGLSAGVSSERVDTLIQYILTDCGWRWGVSVTNSGVVPYYISDGTRSALDEINDLTQSMATQYFFIDSLGTARFSGGTSRSISQDVALKDIGNPFPYLIYRNIVRYHWSTYGSTSYNTITYPASTAGITTPNTFSYINKWSQSSTISDALAGTIYNTVSTKQPTPIIKFVNRPSYQFWELFDEVQLTISALGVNGVYFLLGGIEHNGTPQELTTTYYFEPYI